MLLIEPRMRSENWSKGTRIYMTVGNHHKILESVLIQTFCSVSKQFLTLSLLFKKFISEISNKLQKNEKKARVVPNLSVTFDHLKWSTVILVLAGFMQCRGWLPKISRGELEQIY